MAAIGSLIEAWKYRNLELSAGTSDLERALRARIARPSIRATRRQARIVFEEHDRPGGTIRRLSSDHRARFTIDISDGRTALLHGAHPSPDAIVRSDTETLIAVLDGRLAGVQAFLEGRLFMRGNIALALELDDLLEPITPRTARMPRCHRVLAGDVCTFYLEAGDHDAPPVILIHGLGATAASFLPTLWDLARDFRVLAVDVPGFGETDKPLRPLRPAYFAKWMNAFLDAVGIERAHFVGNSMGGRIALELGLRLPRRTERLVMLTPSLAWRRFRAAVRLVRLIRPELAITPIWVEHRLVIAMLKATFARPDRIPDAALHAAADEFIRIFETPRGRIACLNAAREIYLEDPHGRRGFWDRLKKLDRPALFIFGDKDWLVPRAFRRHVEAALPNAICETFEDCGHVPQFELPEKTNNRIRAFLTTEAPLAKSA